MTSRKHRYPQFAFTKVQDNFSSNPQTKISLTAHKSTSSEISRIGTLEFGGFGAALQTLQIGTHVKGKGNHNYEYFWINTFL